MKKILFPILLFSFLAVSCTTKPDQKANPSPTPPYTETMTVGSKKINVQVVSSEKEMEQGLSGRNKLTDEQGMLFDFRNTNTNEPKFWMKDMRFNLDFIWMYQNKIIGITEHALAPTSTNEQLPIYTSPSDVDMVLEVNDGWAKQNNINVGDTIAF